MNTLCLNDRAARLCDEIESRAAELRAAVTTTVNGTRVIDVGAKATGGLAAGLLLARVCMADLATITLVPGDRALWPGWAVQVHTDHPVDACMASQYAGWQLAAGKFFAMGSGPMRAAAAKEELFKDLQNHEVADKVVGVLESSKLPPDEICLKIATDCGVAPERVTLLVARTASRAGTLQVVARAVETALHKLHELGFDLTRISSAAGTAPLPPIAADDLTGIGWTNDAVLYGGEVTLWVHGDDASLAEIGPRVPSSASADYGEPFASIFDRYQRDFYKIDPLLFSPASVTFMNLDTGRTQRFGSVNPEVLARSFGGSQ
ncbi:MAG TPA: methenyltetrahydromethanopterin cyclohydrolase [Pirellulaceae bacterium]|nr:methenyltetrahydromethanopterin cyclohydrolase [Pirellulaceae bacterium]